MKACGTVGPASKSWRSQKLAILESLSAWLERQSDYASLSYFGAFGFFLQWWLSNAVNASIPGSGLHAVLVLVAITTMLLAASASLLIFFVQREVRRRMDF